MSSILYTILTTKEYPPKNLKKFRENQNRSFSSMFKEFTKHFVEMPLTMKKLGIIQFFSWFAFFTMWSMANPAITEHVFNSPIPLISEFDLTEEVQLAQFNSENLKFQKASNLTGSYMGTYGLSSMLFALILTLYTAKRKINRKKIHLWSLILGGIGFISMYFISNHNLLIVSFSLIGISWGSILSMPYAMLSSSVNKKTMGTSMGIFNMFIVIPQIIAAVGGINLLSSLLGNKAIFSMVIAGICLIIAGLLNLLITDKKTISY